MKDSDIVSYMARDFWNTGLGARRDHEYEKRLYQLSLCEYRIWRALSKGSYEIIFPDAVEEKKSEITPMLETHFSVTNKYNMTHRIVIDLTMPEIKIKCDGKPEKPPLFELWSKVYGYSTEEGIEIILENPELRQYNFPPTAISIFDGATPLIMTGENDAKYQVFRKKVSNNRIAYVTAFQIPEYPGFVFHISSMSRGLYWPLGSGTRKKIFLTSDLQCAAVNQERIYREHYDAGSFPNSIDWAAIWTPDGSFSELNLSDLKDRSVYYVLYPCNGRSPTAQFDEVLAIGHAAREAKVKDFKVISYFCGKHCLNSYWGDSVNIRPVVFDFDGFINMVHQVKHGTTPWMWEFTTQGLNFSSFRNEKLLCPNIRQDSLTVIHGASRKQISLWGMSLAFSIAQGRTMIPGWSIQDSNKVLYLYCDTAEFTIANQLDIVLKGFLQNPGKEDIDARITPPPPQPDLGVPEHNSYIKSFPEQSCTGLGISSVYHNRFFFISEVISKVFNLAG